ncbi:large subunit ribosomal protein L17 [Tessaracoccus bendigoensis DSM 12906]|uniref:Large ribosomal subunit protein bL17 n=1 Tax=Tessaracoccus bendigoensis DSM 12906 TaxID=1123357 RepID=A0A1M6HTD0_9ACTN|nr:50S ribosomal protein L17 [Tessaracoccus bendigoensis]SHJ25407.1 large subunit ribosomal protein L17 [Tessaracoccus bendigoensis DSM 12906]
MPKPTKGARLGGSPTHERMILRNLTSQLIEHGRITTTETKARRVQPFAEKVLTKAKRGDLHSRRLVLATLFEKKQELGVPVKASDKLVKKLFDEIAPSLEGREGGYTRITKIGPRKGDNAPMAVIEILTEQVAPKAKPARAAAPVEEAPVEEAPVEEEAPAEVVADAEDAEVVEEAVASEAK